MDRATSLRGRIEIEEASGVRTGLLHCAVKRLTRSKDQPMGTSLEFGKWSFAARAIKNIPLPEHQSVITHREPDGASHVSRKPISAITDRDVRFEELGARLLEENPRVPQIRRDTSL